MDVLHAQQDTLARPVALCSVSPALAVDLGTQAACIAQYAPDDALRGAWLRPARQATDALVLALLDAFPPAQVQVQVQVPLSAIAVAYALLGATAEPAVLRASRAQLGNSHVILGRRSARSVPLASSSLRPRPQLQVRARAPVRSGAQLAPLAASSGAVAATSAQLAPWAWSGAP